MTKFVKGAYRTVSEVHAVLESLRQEGYTESTITLITNADKTYNELHNSTDAHIKLEDPPAEDYTLWEKIMHAFPISSSSDYSKDPDNSTLEPVEDPLLAGYQKELDDGEIIIIVDDIFHKENAFHLDQVDPNLRASQDFIDSDETLQRTPETDSHPDIESMEDVLEQETTYVPEEDTPKNIYPRD
jgi:hypothetical protein